MTSTHSTVPEAFVASASLHAGRVAVEQGDRSLTYRELAVRADALAARLATFGIARGNIVATLTERSIETVIAWLAILKLGAAYLPIDPRMPQEARAKIFAEAQPALLLRAEGIVIPAALGVDVLVLEAEIERAMARVDAQPSESTDMAVGSDALAYIMYTSGSTGQPKGVLVPHRAILRLVLAPNYVRLSTDTIMLQLAPLAFDASTFEIWGALLNGGRLVILPEALPSLDAIGRTLVSKNINTLWLTSGLFHLMVEHQLSSMTTLRYLLAGGDVLSPSHVLRALSALKDCSLINGYGPTENTTFTCCYVVPRSGWGSGSVPIGFPITGTSVHILNEAMQPVAPGEEGQLCTGGDGVSLGYCNRPDLTEERFVDDPFSDKIGARLYLTGDVVRQRPDGAIEYCGRRDRQVKINGFRIELDEIEHVLRGYERLADAAVVLETGADGTKSIVAFGKVGQAEGDSVIAAANAWLSSRLPSYMLPRLILPLAEFPLNANGKVDRAALLALIPSVEQKNLSSLAEGEFAAVLARIFGDLLGTSPDPARNFFELGANSILLLRAQARLQAELKRDVPITAFFQHPTINTLADHLSLNGRESTQSSVAARAARQRVIMARGAMQRIQ